MLSLVQYTAEKKNLQTVTVIATIIAVQGVRDCGMGMIALIM